MNFVFGFFVFCLILEIVYAKNHLRQSKTVNGNNYTVDNSHFMTSIRLYDVDSQALGSGHVCGGAIISENSILTSAHCLYHNKRLLEAKQIRIFAGSVYRYQMTRTTYLTRVSEYIIHEGFDIVEMKDNIALIFIVDPMTLPSKNLASIQLTDSKAVAGKQCEIFGWKIQISGQPIHADILTSANVIILGKDKCDNEDLILDDTSVCVGPNYVKACDTDDGGPLICDGKLQGLIGNRMHVDCSSHHAGLNGLYLDVAPYLSWIDAHKNSAHDFSKHCALSIFRIFLTGIVLVTLR